MIKVGPTHRRQVSSRCQSPVRTDSTCTFCLLIKLLIKTQHMKLKHSVTDRQTDRQTCVSPPRREMDGSVRADQQAAAAPPGRSDAPSSSFRTRVLETFYARWSSF